MADFERQIVGEIPLHEAASFFIAMKRPSMEHMQTKMAGAAADMMDRLARGGPMPEGKAGKFKPVDSIEGTKTAASLKDVEEHTKDRMKSTYRDAGITRGGAKGALGGSALGAAVGALRGGKKGAIKGALGGGTAGVAAGGAAGGVTGSRKGEQVGTHINDMRRKSIIKSLQLHALGERMRKSAQARKVAFDQGGMAGGQPNEMGGQPTPAAAGSDEPPVDATGGTMPVQDPEAAKPTTQPTLPANYMGAEVVGRAAQQANEVGFLRDRLNAATEQNNAMMSQLEQAQAQLQLLQEQSQQTANTVMEATNEAVQASERALQTSVQAANMRMGVNKMREAFLQLASQDPEQLGTMAQQEQAQVDAEQQAVDAQAGTPEQSPSPETGTGAPSANAPGPGGPGPESGGTGASGSASGRPATPSINIKTGSPLATRSMASAIPPGALPGAVAGAGLAALQGYRKSKNVDDAQQEVDDLQEQQTGSFGKALALARAKQRLAQSELRAEHPVAGNVSNVLGGAVGGAVAGTAAHRFGQALKQLV